MRIRSIGWAMMVGGRLAWGAAVAEAVEPAPSIKGARAQATPAQRLQTEGQAGTLSMKAELPRQWRALPDKGNSRISYYAPDGHTVITVRLIPDTLGGPLSERTRSSVLRRYPKAVVKLETPWSGQELKGRLIEFDRPPQGPQASPTTSRLATAVVSGATVEVMLTTTSGEFRETLPLYERFLQTLRVNHNAEATAVAAAN
jgi:hypothetical protein